MASPGQRRGTCGHAMALFVCLFGVLRRFQHCTGHITMGSWKGRGNQYIEFARVVYCKLPTNGKQLPAFPLTAMTGIEPRPQRWEARVEEITSEDDQLSDQPHPSLDEEGELSDSHSQGPDREDLVDVDQELSTEQTYRETLRGVHGLGPSARV